MIEFKYYYKAHDRRHATCQSQTSYTGPYFSIWTAQLVQYYTTWTRLWPHEYKKKEGEKCCWPSRVCNKCVITHAGNTVLDTCPNCAAVRACIWQYCPGAWSITHIVLACSEGNMANYRISHDYHYRFVQSGSFVSMQYSSVPAPRAIHEKLSHGRSRATMHYGTERSAEIRRNARARTVTYTNCMWWTWYWPYTAGNTGLNTLYYLVLSQYHIHMDRSRRMGIGQWHGYVHVACNISQYVLNPFTADDVYVRHHTCRWGAEDVHTRQKDVVQNMYAEPGWIALQRWMG